MANEFKAKNGIITPKLQSTVATGTAPLTVASTTLVSNLNADLLDGNHASDFASASHTHSYLPLAGGTMTGAITFAAGQTWPTFNQNTTGTASNVTGTVAIANGGTGATSAAAALTNLGAAAATHTHNYAGSASAGGPATHIAGGSAGTIPYQTAAGTTAMTGVGTTGQLLQSNGTSAPAWTNFDLAVHAPDSSYKKIVRVATTADLGASTFASNVLTGYSSSVDLDVTTTAASTTATTTSTAGIKVGATISGNANIPAGATVASITNATTFVMSAAATAAGTSVATTFTQTISQLVVDGVALALNDRVLVKDERTLGGLLDATSAKRNGIYTVTATGSTSVPWTLTRAADANASTDLDSAIVNVSVGTSNFGKTYQTRFSGSSTLNTTEMYWTRIVDVNSSSLAATPTTARGVHIDTDTETIMFKSGTITDLAMNAFGITTVQATAASTYTRGSTIYIAGAPVASTNATITTPYSLYIAGGNSYLGAGVNLGGITDTTTAASHYYVENSSDGFIRPKTLANVKAEILGNTNVTFAGPTAARTYTLPDATSTLAANNQTMYIGTTAVAINRASASLALTGITSIDGSAAKLTTAKGFSIGNTTRNFDGTLDVVWSLADIGAAAASHTHSYAGSASAGGAANSVANSFIVKFGTGTTEGTDLYTFNGSAAKTIDIKPGTNVTFTEAAGSITINANDTSVGWSEITSKPTTLSGYGITDAASSTHTHSYLPLAGGTVTGVTIFSNTTASTSTTTGAVRIGGGLGVGGAVYAGGNVVANSDERLKQDWQDLQHDYVEQLATIKHGTYTRIDSGERQVGVSAQSLQQLLPEAVDGTEYLAVAYGNAALVSAVQLAKRVVEQDARIAKLEALVSQLLEQKQ